MRADPTGEQALILGFANVTEAAAPAMAARLMQAVG